MSHFEPNLSVLPDEQRALWPQLAAVPSHFVLYGGTGLALRLGHRRSVDFDFMSDRSFVPEEIAREVPFLERAERLQSASNTLTVSINPAAPVALSFFGGIRFGRVGVPDRVMDIGLAVASILDLAATKMAVVQQRAEAKDYLDIFAILASGLPLETSLGAARAIYGISFNPAITLKALAYFEDGDLPSLPREVRETLRDRASQVGPIPELVRASRSLAPDPEDSVSAPSS